MRTNVSRFLGLIFGTLILSCGVTWLHERTAAAQTSGQATPSLDVHALPARSDIAIQAISLRDLASANPSAQSTTGEAAAAQSAVQAVVNNFRVPASAIDYQTPVVAAEVQPIGHPQFGPTVAWVVTANVSVMGQGPATQNTAYQKMEVVVDARTNNVLFGYAVDPVPAS